MICLGEHCVLQCSQSYCGHPGIDIDFQIFKVVDFHCVSVEHVQLSVVGRGRASGDCPLLNLSQVVMSQTDEKKLKNSKTVHNVRKCLLQFWMTHPSKVYVRETLF